MSQTSFSRLNYSPLDFSRIQSKYEQPYVKQNLFQDHNQALPAESSLCIAPLLVQSVPFTTQSTYAALSLPSTQFNNPEATRAITQCRSWR